MRGRQITDAEVLRLAMDDDRLQRMPESLAPVNGREHASNRLILPRQPAEQAAPPRFPLLSAADILSFETPAELVSGLAPAGGIVVISGGYGTFKSFAVLDFLASIAAGLGMWAGRQIQQGRVLYSYA